MLGIEVAEIDKRDIEKGETDVEVEKEEARMGYTNEDLMKKWTPSFTENLWISLNTCTFVFIVSKIYNFKSEISAACFSLFLIGRMYFMLWVTKRRLGMPNQLIGRVWISVGDGIALVSALILREVFPYDGSDSSRNSLLILVNLTFHLYSWLKILRRAVDISLGDLLLKMTVEAAIYISTGHEIVCICIVFFFCSVMCYKYILYSVPISLEDKKDDLELVFEFSLEIIRWIIRSTQLDLRVARLFNQVIKILAEGEKKMEVITWRIGFSEEDLEWESSFAKDAWISLNISTFLFMVINLEYFMAQLVPKIHKISEMFPGFLMLFFYGKFFFVVWVSKRRFRMPNQLIGRVWRIFGDGIALVSALILRKAFPYDGIDSTRNALLVLVNLTLYLYSWLKIMRWAVDISFGNVVLEMIVQAAIYVSTGHDIVCICIVLFFCGVRCYQYISFSIPIGLEDEDKGVNELLLPCSSD